MVISGRNSSVVHTNATAPHHSWSNRVSNTIWPLPWYLYTRRLGTTSAVSISVGGYPSGGCDEGKTSPLCEETFRTMKLTYAIPLAFVVTLISNPLPVSAQLTESVSNLYSARIHLAQLKFPDNGAPTGRRKGGTSRDGCTTPNTPLTALVPGEETSVKAGTSFNYSSKSFLASTVAEHPTFWFYVPDLPASLSSSEFVLQNELEQDVYRTTLTLPQKPGVISISLPKSPLFFLEINQKYRWYLKVYCDQAQKTDGYLYVDGWVQRVALTPALERQLNTAKSRQYMVYAAHNIWYDALTNLAELRRTDSQNTVIAQDWANLLQAVGLQDLGQEPIIHALQPISY